MRNTNSQITRQKTNDTFLHVCEYVQTFPLSILENESFFMTKTENSKVNRRILCEMKMENA